MFGSAAYARAHGCADGPLVAVRRSTVAPGAGRGVVALRELPRGALVTEYAGDMRPPGTACSNAELDFALEVPVRHAPDGRPGWLLVGRRDPRPGDGVAQIANDAVHPCATNRSNNCEFHWEGGACFLRATRRILPGQELMVSYHLVYWLGKRAEEHLRPRARRWLGAVRAANALLIEHGFFLDDWVQQQPQQQRHFASALTSGFDCSVRVGPRADRPQCAPPACACPEGRWSGDPVSRPMWLDLRCVPNEARRTSVASPAGWSIQWRCNACKHLFPMFFDMRSAVK